MRTIRIWFWVVSSVLKTLQKEVWPEDEKGNRKPLPPIRYDGDPTEIYLA